MVMSYREQENKRKTDLANFYKEFPNAGRELAIRNYYKDNYAKAKQQYQEIEGIERQQEGYMQEAIKKEQEVMAYKANLSKSKSQVEATRFDMFSARQLRPGQRGYAGRVTRQRSYNLGEAQKRTTVSEIQAEQTKASQWEKDIASAKSTISSNLSSIGQVKRKAGSALRAAKYYAKGKL
jgi:hypothetical protein